MYDFVTDSLWYLSEGYTELLLADALFAKTKFSFTQDSHQWASLNFMVSTWLQVCVDAFQQLTQSRFLQNPPSAHITYYEGGGVGVGVFNIFGLIQHTTGR